MRNLLSWLLITGFLISIPLTSLADPLAVDSADSVASLLGKYKGKRVSIRVSSGDELTGSVGEVTDKLVVLHELSGREFFDAAVNIEKISAIIVRTK